MNVKKEKVRYILLSMGPATIKNRKDAADEIIKDPELLPYLIQEIFDGQCKTYHKAAWILEIMLDIDLSWINDHLDIFTKGISSLKHESAIRPSAKICQWIARVYVKEEDLVLTNELKKVHIQRMIETCFDWLIGEHKVATKVYTMGTLFYLGQLEGENYKWIHNELHLIISNNLHSESPAYLAQGKKILRLLGK